MWRQSLKDTFLHYLCSTWGRRQRVTSARPCFQPDLFWRCTNLGRSYKGLDGLARPIRTSLVTENGQTTLGYLVLPAWMMHHQSPSPPGQGKTVWTTEITQHGLLATTSHTRRHQCFVHYLDLTANAMSSYIVFN